jgi:hypothetical protein
MVDAVDGLIQSRFRPHCGSDLAWGHKLGIATCLPLIVPRAIVPRVLVPRVLTSPIIFLTRSRSRALVSGTPFNCLPSFSGRGCLRPALNHPLSPGIPNLLAAANRRRCTTVERHHSSPTGVSHPRKSIPRSRTTTTQLRQRSPRRELPASTQRTKRPRVAKSSIRTI